MTSDQSLLARMDLYLRNMLSDGERADLERQMDSDAAMRREFEQYRGLMSSLKRMNDTEFRTHFKTYARTLDDNAAFEEMKGFGMRGALVVGAAVVLFAGAVLSWFLCSGGE